MIVKRMYVGKNDKLVPVKCQSDEEYATLYKMLETSCQVTCYGTVNGKSQRLLPKDTVVWEPEEKK